MSTPPESIMAQVPRVPTWEFELTESFRQLSIKSEPPTPLPSIDSVMMRSFSPFRKPSKRPHESDHYEAHEQFRKYTAYESMGQEAIDDAPNNKGKGRALNLLDLPLELRQMIWKLTNPPQPKCACEGASWHRDLSSEPGQRQIIPLDYWQSENIGNNDLLKARTYGYYGLATPINKQILEESRAVAQPAGFQACSYTCFGFLSRLLYQRHETIVFRNIPKTFKLFRANVDEPISEVSLPMEILDAQRPIPAYMDDPEERMRFLRAVHFRMHATFVRSSLITVNEYGRYETKKIWSRVPGLDLSVEHGMLVNRLSMKPADRLRRLAKGTQVSSKRVQDLSDESRADGPDPKRQRQRLKLAFETREGRLVQELEPDLNHDGTTKDLKRQRGEEPYYREEPSEERSASLGKLPTVPKAEETTPQDLKRKRSWEPLYREEAAQEDAGDVA